MLKCPVYVGEIAHRGQVYPGLHEPIVDRDVWDRTQALLATNLQGKRSGANNRSPSLLAGKVIVDAGQPLIATHASKPSANGGEGSCLPT
jgi:site-specific DNA recombinase